MSYSERSLEARNGKRQRGYWSHMFLCRKLGYQTDTEKQQITRSRRGRRRATIGKATIESVTFTGKRIELEEREYRVYVHNCC